MFIKIHRNTSIFIIISIVVSFFTFINVNAASINATITAGIFAPSAPINLAVSIDDESVDLSWSTPSSNGGSAITDYVIEYKLTSGGIWTTFADGVSTDTTVTVINLTNDTSYDFRVSAVNSIGQGSVSSPVSATPGSPAQVIIQSMTSTIISNIAANVRITNEGTNAYEYQYTWCVTDSETNLCGGGNDLFNSSAAKLIQPSENFDTSLVSSVSSTGNYWLHLVVNFGSDSSYANRSFTATSNSTGTPSGSRSGGGGGGGGAATSPVALIPIPSTAGDFNGDNKVTSVDFSILLAFWKKSPPFKNPNVDINKDNKVDSVDFSILLYQWSKSIKSIL